jgi:hypothetical protein
MVSTRPKLIEKTDTKIVRRFHTGSTQITVTLKKPVTTSHKSDNEFGVKPRRSERLRKRTPIATSTNQQKKKKVTNVASKKKNK